MSIQIVYSQIYGEWILCAQSSKIYRGLGDGHWRFYRYLIIAALLVLPALFSTERHLDIDATSWERDVFIAQYPDPKKTLLIA